MKQLSLLPERPASEVVRAGIAACREALERARESGK